jgi:hypothetical protein
MYLYLVTASMYQARYKGYDGLERNSVFNGNFVFNVLAGKEFTLKAKNVFSVDAKVVWAGSNRYLPFSSQQLAEYHHIRIDDWNNAYNQRMKDFFRINLRFGYRINLFKASHEIALDIYCAGAWIEKLINKSRKFKISSRLMLLPIGLLTLVLGVKRGRKEVRPTR